MLNDDIFPFFLIVYFWKEAITDSNTYVWMTWLTTVFYSNKNLDWSQEKQLIMTEARPSISESSSTEQPGGGVTNDDADDFELLQRLEKIE